MNPSKRTLALGLALALGAGSADLAVAQEMPGGMMGGGQGGSGPGMMGDMPCPMMSERGMGMMQPMLEPEQRMELRELMQTHRPAQFERMGQLMNLRDDLVAQMHEERPDPEAIQELHALMAELHGEMMAERVRLHNTMQELLTEEQRQQRQKGMTGEQRQ